MANSKELSTIHEGLDKTKSDKSSHRQAVNRVAAYLSESHPQITFEVRGRISLAYIDEKLNRLYPNKELVYFRDNASFIPTGGVIWAYINGNEYPILIAEMKKQGTNDVRSERGQGSQAQGNAIERISKDINISKMIHSDLPYNSFVCFGYGCDFYPESPIMDRIACMNDFYSINRKYVKKDGFLQPVTLFFRIEEWKEEEQFDIMLDIAEQCLEMLPKP
jgi:type II restriction enzyme